MGGQAVRQICARRDNAHKTQARGERTVAAQKLVRGGEVWTGWGLSNRGESRAAVSASEVQRAAVARVVLASGEQAGGLGAGWRGGRLG